MKALTYQGKEAIRYQSVRDPRIEAATDVVLRVHLSAVCGSDLHVYYQRDKGLDVGTVMGHEFVGEVVEVGEEVESLKKGEMVFGPFTTNCGRCFYCLKGLTCRCPEGQFLGWVENGQGLHGTQAEFVRIPLASSSLLCIPDGVLPEEALLLGDVLSTGFFCAQMAEVSPGGVYAVLGCGPVGLMAIVAARELGGEKIYAVDSVPERLELARSFGAVAIDLRRQDPIAILKEQTDGRGTDAVLEAVGSPSAARLAVDLVRPVGIVATAGMHTEDAFAFTPREAYDKNLTYRTGRCSARHYMEHLIPMVQRREYNLTSIISHRLPLSAGVDGYKMFAEKREGCTKAVLTCS